MRHSPESDINTQSKSEVAVDHELQAESMADQQSDEQAVSVSRRHFLETGSRLAVAAAAFGFMPDAFARDKQADEEPGLENAEVDAEYVKFLNEINKFRQSFNDTDKETEEPRPKPIGMRGKDKAHDMFIERFKEKIQWALGKAFTRADVQNRKETDPDIFIIRDDRHILYDAMKQFDALGLYYEFTSTKQIDPDRESFEKQAGWRQDIFLTRTSDYIPFQDGYENYDSDSREANDIRNKFAEDAALISDNPGLNKTENYVRFCEMMFDTDIRAIFKKQNTTIAEMYSTLKAVIKKQAETGEFADKQETLKLIGVMLEAEAKLKKFEFLGPNTKHLISFSHPKENGDSFNRTFDELKKVVKNNHGLNVVHLQPSESTETTAQDTQDKKTLLRMAIQMSEGGTLIHFDAHGLKDEIHLGPGVTYTIDEMARDLLVRLGTGNNATLAEVGIINDACFSTDFGERLGKRISALLTERALDTKDIRLPNVVSTAQTGSLARGNIFADALEDLRHVIAAEKKISGELLIRGVQPRVYDFEDMAFFTDTPNMGFTEIGKDDFHANVEQSS